MDVINSGQIWFIASPDTSEISTSQSLGYFIRNNYNAAFISFGMSIKLLIFSLNLRYIFNNTTN
jgi:hypothetical protein